MKYRYYIFEFDGQVTGTNKEETAKHFALGNYAVVVDTETGKELVEDQELDIESADSTDSESPA